MLSSKKKPDIDVQKDGRVILRGMAYTKMKVKLGQLADWKCENEGCGRRVMQGDVHHANGRGGGNRYTLGLRMGERGSWNKRIRPQSRYSANYVRPMWFHSATMT
jgi:hypothetical protein